MVLPVQYVKGKHVQFCVTLRDAPLLNDQLVLNARYIVRGV